MASLREQIDEGKKNLALTLTPVSQELAEAEHRAADRLNNLSKQSISEGVCLVPNQTTLTGVP